MLSQLTFRESESFDQGRRSEMRRPPDQFRPPFLGVRSFFLTHPPSLREKYVHGSFVVYWNYAPKRMAFLKWAALTYLGLKRAVLTHDVVQTTDTLEDDQPAVQGICWGAAVDGQSMSYGIYVPTQWE